MIKKQKFDYISVKKVINSNLCSIVDLLFGVQSFCSSSNFRLVDRITIVVLDRDLIVRLLDVHQSRWREGPSGRQQEEYGSNEALKPVLDFPFLELWHVYFIAFHLKKTMHMIPHDSKPTTLNAMLLWLIVFDWCLLGRDADFYS